MVGKYKLAMGWRILALVIGPAFFLMFLLLAFGTLFADDMGGAPRALWSLTYALLAAVSLYGILDVTSSYYLITDTSILKKTPTGATELSLSEIKGYSRNAYYFVLYPKEAGKKNIRVSGYLSDYERLAAWAETSFTNLDSGS